MIPMYLNENLHKALAENEISPENYAPAYGGRARH